MGNISFPIWQCDAAPEFEVLITEPAAQCDLFAGAIFDDGVTSPVPLQLGVLAAGLPVLRGATVSSPASRRRTGLGRTNFRLRTPPTSGARRAPLRRAWV